jgi:hypothetical protein
VGVQVLLNSKAVISKPIIQQLHIDIDTENEFPEIQPHKGLLTGNKKQVLTLTFVIVRNKSRKFLKNINYHEIEVLHILYIIVSKICCQLKFQISIKHTED